MAVSIVTTLSQHAGNDSTVTPYPTGFPFQAASHLRVYVTDAAGVSTLLTMGTHYSVTGAGNPSGGNVVTVGAYDDTHTITIARVTPRTQTLDLEYNDRLPAQLVEDALDKAMLAIQEIAGDRPLRFPATEPLANDTELPDPAARKGCVFGFDETTGEAVLYELPLPIVPLTPPDSGTYVLTAIDGVLQWTGTVNCA